MQQNNYNAVNYYEQCNEMEAFLGILVAQMQIKMFFYKLLFD